MALFLLICCISIAYKIIYKSLLDFQGFPEIFDFCAQLSRKFAAQGAKMPRETRKFKAVLTQARRGTAGCTDALHRQAPQRRQAAKIAKFHAPD